MEPLLRLIKKIVPKQLFKKLQPVYHYALAIIGATIYRFPAKQIKIVAITGTKGKTSVAELINGILEATGHKTALSSTIRFKIGEKSRPNLYRMTMPGRFFVQKFLREAVTAKCNWAIIEMTSEGAKQFRHVGVELDALVFTNLSPEHIESHGSFENYKKSKLSLVSALEKKSGVMIANTDDISSADFLTEAGKRGLPKKTFSLNDVASSHSDDVGTTFLWRGTTITSPLPGIMNLRNLIAAATFGESQNIPYEKIAIGLGSVKRIPGRTDIVPINSIAEVIVDYAHTPESLTALYQTYLTKKRICVLGGTGGGRDTWKRPVMGGIADQFCDQIILTNEDPYDENPETIIKEIESGIKHKKVEIIIDRREAIREGIKRAIQSSTAGNPTVVLVTGKGTDPTIEGKNGTSIKWSDRRVAEEEIISLSK